MVHIKIIISTNSTWNLVNFRSGLITSLVENGYDVLAIAPKDKYVDMLRKLGCRYQSLPINSKGKNPFQDIILILKFLKIFLRERPNIYLAYTIKPNIYGSMAAHILGINVINNVAGLGTVFVNKNWITLIVKFLYRIAFKYSKVVFFQNNDDLMQFINSDLIIKKNAHRLPGSGVDLKKFLVSKVSSFQQKKSHFQFLLVARLLWDKGVGEYVAAARLLRNSYTDINFCILGFLDVKNPNAISRAQMDEWVNEGIIVYLGSSDDVRSYIADADCVVLPSYYGEGVPRALLESAAMERPIITTNSVGCRDVVDHGINGYLCTPRDSANLAEMMEKMFQLSEEARLSMGKLGRKKMEREFDEKIVIDRYLNAIKNITKNA